MIERLNEFLYDTKGIVLRIAKGVSIVSALLALTLIVYENGYHLSPEQSTEVHKGMDAIFTMFCLVYFVRLLYSFDRLDFLKHTWFEGVIVASIVYVGLSRLIFGHYPLQAFFQNVDYDHYRHHYWVFVTLSMLYLVGIEFVRVSRYLNSLALKPAGTFILSFIVLIGIGTGLLMLPQMTTGAGGADFLTALFTSTSASCVTGLSVVDVSTYFTFKGKLVLLLLIQFGGIGIVSFATFFAMFMKDGVGLKQQVILQDFLSSESLSSAKALLRKIVFMTLTIEAISTVLIFFTWGREMVFGGFWQRVFFSVFHAVSAFCNAGFSLFSDGLYQQEIRHSLLLHVVIALTIIMGSLGFSTVEDLFSPRMLRERMEKPWKDWKLSTKVSLFMTMILVFVGMGVFYFLERAEGGTLSEVEDMRAIVGAFFQSVTTRTAGFNTVNFSALRAPTLIFMIFLMFVGASSGSTGGGIKTSTFLLILTSALATIRGKKNMEMGNRSIPQEMLGKAFSIFVFAAVYILTIIFILSITESNLDIVSVTFEAVSAFSTTGLSTGITNELSVQGKSIIILSMFIGRIGTLTLALALSSRVVSTNYKYPSAHLMIG